MELQVRGMGEAQCKPCQIGRVLQCEAKLKLPQLQPCNVALTDGRTRIGAFIASNCYHCPQASMSAIVPQLQLKNVTSCHSQEVRRMAQLLLPPSTPFSLLLRDPCHSPCCHPIQRRNVSSCDPSEASFWSFRVTSGVLLNTFRGCVEIPCVMGMCMCGVYIQERVREVPRGYGLGWGG